MHFTSLERFLGGFATMNGDFATMMLVLSFYFCNYLTKSLKNHSKSQKIIK